MLRLRIIVTHNLHHGFYLGLFLKFQRNKTPIYVYKKSLSQKTPHQIINFATVNLAQEKTFEYII